MPSSTDGCKKEWITLPIDNSFGFGKIIKKTSKSNFIYQHWMMETDNGLLKKCSGCVDTNDTTNNICMKRGHYNDVAVIKVETFSIPINDAAVIKVEIFSKLINDAYYRILTPIELLKKRKIVQLRHY
jgi:phage-related tail fiber protein